MDNTNINTDTNTDKDIIEIFMEKTKDKSGRFRHLVFANQTYWEHFNDSFGYFKTSLCASLCFLCHAFWPDIFEQSGSKKINDLNDKIRIKYAKRINEIKCEINQ